jgi:hypothetical protein
MLYVFGTKGKAIKGKVVENEACTHCGQTTQVVTPVIRYFHIFWIPVFLYKKIFVLVCPHCKKQTTSKQVFEPKASKLKELAYEGVNTYFYYTGAVFIAAVLLFSMFQ